MNNIEKIEEKLKELVLKKVEFRVDGRSIKNGKIRVFNTKQFYIKFKMEGEEEGEDKEFDLPYPFKIKDSENGMIFDYCLSAFIPRTETAYWKTLLYDKSEASRLHNNYLHIVEV